MTLVTVVTSAFVWVPFAAVAIPLIVIFARRGYKYGLFRALIALIATAISAALSVIIAKAIPFGGISKISSAVNKIVPRNSDIAGAASEGFGRAICTLFIFIPIFIILTVLLKWPARLLAQKAMGITRNHDLKVCGIFVGIIDALLVALTVMFPIHTAEYYAGGLLVVVWDIKSEHSEFYSEELQFAHILRDHPLTVFSRVSPYKEIGDELLSFEYKGQTAYITPVLDGVYDGLMLYFDAADSEEGQKRNELADKVADTLVENASRDKFTEDLTCELLKSAGNKEFKDYASTLDSENFDENIKAVSKYIAVMIKDDSFGVTNVEALSDAQNSDKKIEAVFKTLDSTDELVKYKGNLFRSYAYRVLNSSNNAEIDTVLAQVGNRKLSDAEIKAETDSFRQMARGIVQYQKYGNTKAEQIEAAADVIEGIARHPEIPTSDMKCIAENLLVQSETAEGSGVFEAVINDLINGDRLTAVLDEALTHDPDDSTFKSYLITALNTDPVFISLASGNTDDPFDMKELLMSSPDAAALLSEKITPDYITYCGFKAESPEKACKMAVSLLNAIPQSRMSEQEAEKEAEAVNYVMSAAMNASGKNAGKLSDVIGSFEAFAKSSTGSEILSVMIHGLITDESGKTVNDPLNLFGRLSKADKSTANAVFEAIDTGDGKIHERISDLKIFLGL